MAPLSQDQEPPGNPARFRIVAELGYGDDAASGLRNRVRANLRYLEKGERVLKDGKGIEAVWRLA